MKFVADNWNIELYGVGGTSVQHRVKDSADTKNAELWKKLDQTKNIDSKKEFRNQVISEMINIQTAQNILDSNEKVKIALEQLKNSDSDSYTELELKKENGVYVWQIYSIEKDKYLETSIAEFNAVVDLNTKLVEIEPIKKN